MIDLISETIGPKTVSALLRQNATIEPVDTSRGVGKHLVSLLTTASKETGTISFCSFPVLPPFFSVGYKQTSRDAIIEERYKVKSIINSFFQILSFSPLVAFEINQSLVESHHYKSFYCQQ